MLKWFQWVYFKSIRRLRRVRRTPRMMLISVLLGVVGALAAELFIWLLKWAQALILTPLGGYSFLTESEAVHMGTAPSTPHWLWMIPLATTLGGLLSGFLVYTFAPEAEGHGTDAAVKSYHNLNGFIRGRIPLVKALASAITIGSGGAAGREGPIVQIAGGVGSFIGRVLRLSQEERRYLLLIGLSAGLSAIFKSPLGSAIFAVEVLYSTMAYEGEVLIYTIISSAVAYAVNGFLTDWKPLFTLTGKIPPLNQGMDLFWFTVLGVAAGVVGAILPTVFYQLRDAFRALRIPNMLKPALGGLILGSIGIFVPQILGGGYGWMQLAIQGNLPLYLMMGLVLGKIIALSLTVSSGGSGGVFAPSLYVGVMVGGSVAIVVHFFSPGAANPVAFTVVGMAALFGGAARVPVATLIMVTEMTGGYTLILPTMLAVAISFVVQSALSRSLKYPTLYEAQVPKPMQSPAHRAGFYNAVAAMLRAHTVRLDGELVRQEVAERLAQGEAIPLASGPRGEEFLFTLHLESDSPLSGVCLKNAGIPNGVLLVSVFRDKDIIVPHGDTTFESGDTIILASTEEEFEKFKNFIRPRSGNG